MPSNVMRWCDIAWHAMRWCYVIENLFDMILKRPHVCAGALSTVESYFFAAPILFDVRTYVMWLVLFLMPATNAEHCLLGEFWCIWHIFQSAMYMNQKCDCMYIQRCFQQTPGTKPRPVRIFSFGDFGMSGVCFKRTLELYTFTLVKCLSYISIHTTLAFTSRCVHIWPLKLACTFLMYH